MLCVVLGITLARQRIGAQLEFRHLLGRPQTALPPYCVIASPQKQGEKELPLNNCVETPAGLSSKLAGPTHCGQSPVSVEFLGEPAEVAIEQSRAVPGNTFTRSASWLRARRARRRRLRLGASSCHWYFLALQSCFSNIFPTTVQSTTR